MLNVIIQDNNNHHHHHHDNDHDNDNDNDNDNDHDHDALRDNITNMHTFKLCFTLFLP